MSNKIQAPRGMNDILPQEIHYWHFLENILRDLAKCYGYQEIRTPIVEATELFKRAVGEVTDIVEKEMFIFDDRADMSTSLCLRPEGTAGCVRAGIENSLFYGQTQRLWYLGPLFRHERPQKGRYRQFYQFGIEAFGFTGPHIDAEVILLSVRLWKDLGIEKSVTLQLNSLGKLETRQRYKQVLIDYFTQNNSALDEDSQRRLSKNPLRILDSKNPTMQDLIANAPKLTDYLDAESFTHFEKVQSLLTQMGVDFVVNPRLVRGLDYYNDIVFEWVTDVLGAQNTICAGGRYDNLVSQLGENRAVPAVGFALGCERVIEVLKMVNLQIAQEVTPDIFFIMMGDAAQNKGLFLTEKIRQEIPNIQLITSWQGGDFKTQFKRADKSKAKLALILADSELKNEVVSIKFLRENKDQLTVSWNDLIKVLRSL